MPRAAAVLALALLAVTSLPGASAGHYAACGGPPPGYAVCFVRAVADHGGQVVGGVINGNCFLSNPPSRWYPACIQ